MGLLTSRLGLSFKVEAAHFRDAPPSATHSRRLFELRCTSAFRGQVRSRVVQSTIYAPPSLSWSLHYSGNRLSSHPGPAKRHLCHGDLFLTLTVRSEEGFTDYFNDSRLSFTC
ncbi:hypothetical protein J437_LFUL000270 [Ladona fulva]|uniref:Uncharacterized protein n=1 Tax=Ladona fulva TaxID=123851 RepID=A0A8K0NYT9_LADFU|nr:hypothetical protein J437_LFUL000270 [Ladona fulva]